MVDLQRALEHARAGADLACEIMMERYRGHYGIHHKAGAESLAGSVVTDVDIECDETLRKFFGDAYPGCAIVSEEADEATYGAWQESEWAWFIDPIDGTLGYIHTNDNFGVSICLAHRGKPVLGVLKNPARGLEAWAIENGGAYVNGSPVDLGGDSGDPLRLILSSNQDRLASYRKARAIIKPASIVSLGSIVTKVIFLLQNKGDIYFSLPQEIFGGGTPRTWDLAAATAIVAEAGGAAIDFYGEEIRFAGATAWRRGHIFSRRAAATAILEMLRPFIEERRSRNK